MGEGRKSEKEIVGRPNRPRVKEADTMEGTEQKDRYASDETQKKTQCGRAGG